MRGPGRIPGMGHGPVRAASTGPVADESMLCLLMLIPKPECPSVGGQLLWRSAPNAHAQEHDRVGDYRIGLPIADEHRYQASAIMRAGRFARLAVIVSGGSSTGSGDSPWACSHPARRCRLRAMRHNPKQQIRSMAATEGTMTLSISMLRISPAARVVARLIGSAAPAR